MYLKRIGNQTIASKASTYMYVISELFERKNIGQPFVYTSEIFVRWIE